MTDDPDKWGAYTRLQTDLNKTYCINNRTWALEAAISAMIETGAAGTPADTERIVATAERRERYRARLRRVYASDLTPQGDGADGVEARTSLSILHDRLKPEDWMLISSIASGEDYGSIATRTRATAASLRVRTLRIRRRLIQLAA
ncbi:MULTISPECIES: hypothetical protein [Bradyrhizobium]|uniref:hypothetical protein n=1 Tax=Bradyrhizobium TaxID=374 RepID=UPI00195B15DA|nr:hypothetical protein [Bradyrhizobium canariense]MBM7486109.1 hypothetical protein [Bradyrhizobium canariense]